MQPGSFAPPPPQPVKKKSNIWLWVLGGVGAFILLVVGALVVGGLFIAKTVKDVASNPAKLAEIIARVNPDVEVLDVDDAKKTVRIKDKKSGEVVTVSLEDVMQGKVQISKEGGSDKDGGSASIQIGGKANLPDFVPKYPGAEPQGLVSGLNIGGSGEKGTGGTATFTTKDPLDKVRAFYEEAFKKSGMKIESTTMAAEGGLMAAKSEDDKLNVTVTLGRSGDDTSVVLMYAEKK
jgi:hypothetical protein